MCASSCLCVFTCVSATQRLINNQNCVRKRDDEISQCLQTSHIYSILYKFFLSISYICVVSYIYIYTYAHKLSSVRATNFSALFVDIIIIHAYVYYINVRYQKHSAMVNAFWIKRRVCDLFNVSIRTALHCTSVVCTQLRIHHWPRTFVADIRMKCIECLWDSYTRIHIYIYIGRTYTRMDYPCIRLCEC